jgi:hypothetical protein
MQALNWLFWLTGASIWLALIGYLAAALLGELGNVRAARRFRRKHLAEEDIEVSAVVTMKCPRSAQSPYALRTTWE